MSARKRVCFVTIGATAGFEALLRATLSPSFLTVLREYGYTDLRLQYGKDGRGIFEQFASDWNIGDENENELNISGFDFKKHGIEDEIRATKGQGQCREGIVISHAGIPYHSANSPCTFLP